MSKDQTTFKQSPTNHFQGTTCAHLCEKGGPAMCSQMNCRDLATNIFVSRRRNPLPS